MTDTDDDPLVQWLRERWDEHLGGADPNAILGRVALYCSLVSIGVAVGAIVAVTAVAAQADVSTELAAGGEVTGATVSLSLAELVRVRDYVALGGLGAFVAFTIAAGWLAPGQFWTGGDDRGQLGVCDDRYWWWLVPLVMCGVVIVQIILYLL